MNTSAINHGVPYATPTNLREENQIFNILSAISDDAAISQRQLAVKTGLALSKVNYLLKKLSSKGMLKLRRARKNPRKLGYLYLLTPKGVLEKSRLTYRFIGRTMRQYAEAEARILDGLRRISSNGSCKVVLLGVDETTDLFVKLLKTFDSICLIGIADDQKTGTFVGNIPLIKPEQLSSIDFDYLIPTADYEQARPHLPKNSVQKQLLCI